MSRTIMSLPIFIVAMLGAQYLFNTAHSAPSMGKPVKLEHMDYFSARKIIMSYGWVPVSGPCEQVSAETCASFPEIEACSGVSPGYCGMAFVRRDRCLYVGTSGGEPERKTGDTHVEGVTFRPGPCSKN